MPGLGSLVSGLRPVSQVKRGEIYLIPADENGQPDPNMPPRKFQYFPGSVADNKAVTYQSKEVPGGSLPLYAWTSSGERSISFTAYFSTDVDHALVGQGGTLESLGIKAGTKRGAGAKDEGETVAALNAAYGKAVERLKAAGALERNVFIPGALMWLRSFMLPRYGAASNIGVPTTFAPRKLWLHIPNSGIDLLGGEGGFSGAGIFCHMTQCDITFDAFFPSGNPRMAQVSLGFAEVPQQGGVVRFPQAAKAFDSAVQKLYLMNPSGGSKGGSFF